MYNLTVANDHTFFVGKSGLLSHNAGVCKVVGTINLRHIMSGDQFGGGHSIYGTAINFIQEAAPRLVNGVYKAVVRNPVDGVIETKTFFPDTWDAQKIKNMINLAYTKYVSNGGRNIEDFSEWVHDGKNLVKLRIETRPQGDAVEVLTAHPIYEVHP